MPTPPPTISAPMRRGARRAPPDQARSAVAQTDFHDLEEQRFLHKLSSHLDDAVMAGESSRVMLVAPPRALGVLRKRSHLT